MADCFQCGSEFIGRTPPALEDTALKRHPLALGPVITSCGHTYHYECVIQQFKTTFEFSCFRCKDEVTWLQPFHQSLNFEVSLGDRIQLCELPVDMLFWEGDPLSTYKMDRVASLSDGSIMFGEYYFVPHLHKKWNPYWCQYYEEKHGVPFRDILVTLVRPSTPAEEALFGETMDRHASNLIDGIIEFHRLLQDQ